MSHQTITTDEQLVDYCAELSQADSLAFDTEFVSERTYRPQLCLIQVAADNRMTLIDTMTIDDMRPFWNVLAEPGHETIVHAGRGEMEFCLRAVGKRPAGLFDIQIAAGLIGIEYPAGFGTLISKILGQATSKAETRTDWRKRPLSARQIQYALDDVRYLHAARDKLRARLEELGRIEWLASEMETWQDEVERAISSQRWRRVSGNSGMNRQSLAIVRELWRWRESEAERRNCPVRRVLRDDLIIELARRQSADLTRIKAVRGLERGDLKRQLPKMAARIQKALDLPEEEHPKRVERESTPQLAVLGQFLFAALGNICRKQHLAPSLVGTSSDIREFAAHRLALRKTETLPRLAHGWRAEVIGQALEELLSGKQSIHIDNPLSDHPLGIEKRSGSG